jgi:hypothetical protein|tara:strand:- start:736 stop:906 length:171 start_codon:yes stop_codon:yes gene_type:complete
MAKKKNTKVDKRGKSSLINEVIFDSYMDAINNSVRRGRNPNKIVSRLSTLVETVNK